MVCPANAADRNVVAGSRRRRSRAIGWIIGEQWNLVALKLSGGALSLPAAFQDSGYKPASLLPNVILSGLIGGGAVAIVYGLTQKVASRAPAPIGRDTPLRQTDPPCPPQLDSY